MKKSLLKPLQKKVKMKKLSLSVYKMILFRFGVGPWNLYTTWYGVPAFLAALLTTMCIDF